MKGKYLGVYFTPKLEIVLEENVSPLLAMLQQDLEK